MRETPQIGPFLHFSNDILEPFLEHPAQLLMTTPLSLAGRTIDQALGPFTDLSARDVQQLDKQGPSSRHFAIGRRGEGASLPVRW